MPSRTPLILFTLILLCFSIYDNSLNNAFISDDIEAIVENPHISQPLYYWLQPNNLLNSIGYLIQGYNPFIQHLINVILHSINTILVFFFLCLFFKPDASFLGACIFATHPIHTEAVTWISGRYYLILTFFILTIYLLYDSSINPINSKRRKTFTYILSLSIFSYFIINNIGFFPLTPFLLILSDITFNKWRKNWKLWIPFVVIIIIRLVLARGEILERIDYVRNLIEIDISYSKDPIAYFIYSFYSHLRLLLWPVRLTFYHEPVIMIQNLVNYGLFFSILMIPFLLLTFKKAKEIFFSFCLFFIFLLPTYSPISVSSFFIAERYVYLPSIAFSMSIAFLYERGDYRYKKFRKYFLFVLIIIISLYGLRVILRNEDWKSVDIWRQKTLEASPGSWKAHNNIGSLYLQKGNFRRAIEEFEKAITLNSDSAMIYNNLGIAYQYFGNKEKAISFFKKAIELKPSLVIAYNSLGVIYYELNGRENAILLFNKAIELDSRYANAYTNLGSVYYNIDEYEKAIELYKKAIEINPNLAIAHTNLALAFYFTKQYELAIKHCDKALQLGYKVEPALLKLLKPYRKK